jgi:hypothetical protein
MPETLLNDLRKIALFEGMENDTLQPLGRLCRRITVPAGNTVVSAHQLFGRWESCHFVGHCIWWLFWRDGRDRWRNPVGKC